MTELEEAALRREVEVLREIISTSIRDFYHRQDEPSAGSVVRHIGYIEGYLQALLDNNYLVSDIPWDSLRASTRQSIVSSYYRKAYHLPSSIPKYYQSEPGDNSDQEDDNMEYNLDTEGSSSVKS